LKSIPFAKANACGNDFLVVDFTFAGDNISELSRKLCDRHNGVGADGVEWLLPSSGADIEARLINADGSEAEVSGNGTRCVAACVADHGGASPIRIQTGAGIKSCELLARHETSFEFRTAIGKPAIAGELKVQAAGVETKGTKLSMGNPQFVIFVEDFQPDWQALADAIAKTPHFPQGTNVDFVRVVDRHTLDVRFYERGAGETQSSGTGSCASAVAAIHAGRCESPVRVKTPGGEQTVEWDDEIWLTGPATIVCTGEFFI
jgi:diaminopimelate epimerase